MFPLFESVLFNSLCQFLFLRSLFISGILALSHISMNFSSHPLLQYFVDISKIRVLKSLENLEISGNFCLFGEFFDTRIVFAPSLYAYMPSNFLSPSKTAGKNLKKSGNLEKLSLENLETSESFHQRSPENTEDFFLLFILSWMR